MATSLQTLFTQRCNIQYPIVQAPMAGGAIPLELVAAVSNAGGLGSFGAALSSGEAITQAVAAIRRLTHKPFAVNLFVLDPANPSKETLRQVMDILTPIHAELGIAPPMMPTKFGEDPAAQIDALVHAKVPVASFAFGLPSAETVARLKAVGSAIIGTATNVEEAMRWEALGADVVCAQGMEAGGHRGTFIGAMEASMIGTMALVPQIVDAVKIPVLAAGGIMDGRAIAAALMLGASGAQMGTAFLSCADATTNPMWKAHLRQAVDTSTTITNAYTGRNARGLATSYTQRMRPNADLFPPYHVQSALTAEMRRTAIKVNKPDYFNMWAGQGVAMTRKRSQNITAAQLVATLVTETEVLLSSR